MNWLLIADMIYLTVAGTFVWFFTLRLRANFHEIWSEQTPSIRIAVQDMVGPGVITLYGLPFLIIFLPVQVLRLLRRNGSCRDGRNILCRPYLCRTDAIFLCDPHYVQSRQHFESHFFVSFRCKVLIPTLKTIIIVPFMGLWRFSCASLWLRSALSTRYAPENPYGRKSIS